jgi:hypothetical protein
MKIHRIVLQLTQDLNVDGDDSSIKRMSYFEQQREILLDV